jgi:hypothetical protein
VADRFKHHDAPADAGADATADADREAQLKAAAAAGGTPDIPAGTEEDVRRNAPSDRP